MSDDELAEGIQSASNFLESEGEPRLAGILDAAIVRIAGLKAARTPGTATLGTPVGEIEGRAVLIGGVQGGARQPDVARLLAAARVAMGFIPDRRDHAAAKAELRAAIAEHEAAQPGRPAQP